MKIKKTPKIEKKKELTPIQKAHEAMRIRREAGEVIKKLNPMEKSQKKPTSLRLAVNAKCWDCCVGQKKEVKICPSKDCPLWAVRPYQNAKVEEDELDEEEDENDEEED